MAVSQTTFQKTFGDLISEVGRSVIQASDNGFVIVGNSNSFGAGSSDVYVVKTDSNGQLLWSKTYGSSTAEGGRDLVSTLDNGLAILGSTNGYGEGGYDLLLIRTDNNGDTIWAKTYGGPLDDFGESIKQMNDGGFILAGRTSSYGAGMSDVYLIRTDSTGDLLWSRTYGGTGADQGYCVELTSDSGLIIAGITTSFSQGFTDIYVVKTDSMGNLQWTRTYGSSEAESTQSIKQTQDGGYVICGTQDFGFFAGAYLIKTNGVGDTLWTKLYRGNFNQSERGEEVITTNDGGFVVTGTSNSFSPRGILLMRLTNTGDTVWTKTYGGTVSFDDGFDVILTGDSGLAITGRTGNFNAGGVYLLKTDSNGYMNCNHSVVHPYIYNTITVVDSGGIVDSGGVINSAPLIVMSPPTIDSNVCDTTSNVITFYPDQQQIKIYPNPTTGKFRVAGLEPACQSGRFGVAVRVYDLLGREVTGVRRKVSAGAIEVDLSAYPSGIYFVKVGDSTSKLILTE